MKEKRTRKPKPGGKLGRTPTGRKVTAKLYMHVTPAQRESYVAAAKAAKKPLVRWVTAALDAKIALDSTHSIP